MPEPIVREPILKLFDYDFLAPEMQEVLKPYADKAEEIVATKPSDEARALELRDLLEERNAAGRAVNPNFGSFA